MRLPFNPLSAVATKVYAAIALAAVIGFSAQTLRIEGAICRDIARDEKPLCVFDGFKQDVATLEIDLEAMRGQRDAARHQRDAEARNHRDTKQNYRDAQARAAELEQQRIARVVAQQEEVNHAVVENYAARLADARARADGLRRELVQAGAGDRSASGDNPMSGIPDTAGRAAAASADRGFPRPERRTELEQLERDLIATEQAAQLDALIAWVERQAAIDLNHAPPETP